MLINCLILGDHMSGAVSAVVLIPHEGWPVKLAGDGTINWAEFCSRK